MSIKITKIEYDGSQPTHGYATIQFDMNDGSIHERKLTVLELELVAYNRYVDYGLGWDVDNLTAYVKLRVAVWKKEITFYRNFKRADLLDALTGVIDTELDQ